MRREAVLGAADDLLDPDGTTLLSFAQAQAKAREWIAYATALLSGGAPLEVISANLGHADLRITKRHYAHLGRSFIAETIRASMPNLQIVETGRASRRTRLQGVRPVPSR
jgi:hypothetical protein